MTKEQERDELHRTIWAIANDLRGAVDGTDITGVLPPMSRFTPSGDRAKKKQAVMDKLSAFFRKFWDISGGRW